MRSRPWLSVFIFCFLVVAGLAISKYFQISALIAYAESFPPENQSISTTIVGTGDYQSSQMISAEVIAPNDMNFVAEVAGRIASINVLPGQIIEANSTLLSLDHSEELAKLNAARANLRLADISLKRSRTLNDKSLNSQEQVDIFAAQRDAALAEIDYLNAMIRKKTIISPIGGRVGLHQLNAGEYVNAGQIVMRVVDQSGQLWIDFELPQTLPEPTNGAFLEIFDSQNNFLGNAQVIATDAWIKVSNGNKRIRLTYDNSFNKISAGAYLKVKVPTGKLEQVLVVPTTSVRRDINGAFVYAVVNTESGAFLPHRAAAKRVEILAQRANNFLIKGDISQGDVIATLGAFKLKDEIFVNASGISGE